MADELSHDDLKAAAAMVAGELREARAEIERLRAENARYAYPPERRVSQAEAEIERLREQSVRRGWEPEARAMELRLGRTAMDDIVERLRRDAKQEPLAGWLKETLAEAADEISTLRRDRRVAEAATGSACNHANRLRAALERIAELCGDGESYDDWGEIREAARAALAGGATPSPAMSKLAQMDQDLFGAESPAEAPIPEGFTPLEGRLAKRDPARLAAARERVREKMGDVVPADDAPIDSEGYWRVEGSCSACGAVNVFSPENAALIDDGRTEQPVSVRLSTVHEFLGYLSGALPELHGVECGRILTAWDDFSRATVQPAERPFTREQNAASGMCSHCGEGRLFCDSQKREHGDVGQCCPVCDHGPASQTEARR